MTAEIELKYPFPIINSDIRQCRGGDQCLLKGATLQKVGCGVVSAANLLLYLSEYGDGLAKGPFCGITKDGVVSAHDYNRRCEWLAKSYFPVIPAIGINGVALAAGLELYFKRYGFSYNAKWRFSLSKLPQRIVEMLKQNIPVILAIGQNIPNPWAKNRLPMYEKRSGEVFIQTASARAHYVTVTAMYGNRLRVLSWGREFYIDITEYTSYVKAHSASFASNIVQVC